MATDVDRQVPIGEETFLDHVGYFVTDLDAAGDDLVRLGFQVSPTKVHTNDEGGRLVLSGTSNRMARLRRGFLEVLAATSDTPLAEQLAQAVARHEGLHLIALSHDDLDAQRDRLEAAGLPTQPRISLRNDKQTEHGLQNEEWSVLRLRPGTMPEGRVQFVRSHTPDVSWHPGSTDHPNGADSLTAVWLIVDDPNAAQRYARFADAPLTTTPSGALLALHRGRLILSGPETLRNYLPSPEIPTAPFIAVAAVSADLTRTRAVLRSNGVVPIRDEDHQIWIHRRDALGSYLVFHDLAAGLPWQHR